MARNDESRVVLRPGLACNVTFNNVQFSYPEKPEAIALRNFNLTADDGGSVAIFGAARSGKSIIASLFQRLYEPAFFGLKHGFESLNRDRSCICLNCYAV